MKKISALLIILGLSALVINFTGADTADFSVSGPGISETQELEIVPTDISTNPSQYPVALDVPFLEKTVPIIETGLNKDGSLAVPRSLQTAGWYKLKNTNSVSPSVIVGHSGYPENPGIFADIEDLKTGDTFVVTTNIGSELIYKVDKTVSYSQNSFPTQIVYGDLESDSLRLISCTGELNRVTGKFSHNFVVFASSAD